MCYVHSVTSTSENATIMKLNKANVLPYSKHSKTPNVCDDYLIMVIVDSEYGRTPNLCNAEQRKVGKQRHSDSRETDEY